MLRKFGGVYGVLAEWTSCPCFHPHFSRAMSISLTLRRPPVPASWPHATSSSCASVPCAPVDGRPPVPRHLRYSLLPQFPVPPVSEERRVDSSRRDDSAASPSPQPKPVPAELPSGMSQRPSKKGSWSPPVVMRALRGVLARGRSAWQLAASQGLAGIWGRSKTGSTLR